MINNTPPPPRNNGVFKHFKRLIRWFIPYGFILFQNFQIVKAQKRQKRKELYLEVHLTDHCNLKCKSCSHFSPLSEEKYLEPETFEKDFSRLRELIETSESGENSVAEIHLLGGEPLLNPNICKIIKCARNCFPQALIYIVTNGILLPKQPKEFWETCHNNDILIAISYYPIKIDKGKIFTLADENKVKILYFQLQRFQNSESRVMWKMQLDLNGRQNNKKSFYHCPQSNNCVTLKNGKLYTCPTIAHIHIFNSFFKKDLKVTDKDYIDIYKAKSMDEILDFLRTPPPFCRYCNMESIPCFEWETSDNNITEWTY